MTFLELHNKVLDRLRENRIVSTDIGSNPYVNSISAHINDAKDAVENAWAWGSTRGEDTITLTQGEEVVEIPDSFDSHYLIYGASVDDTGNFLRQKTAEEMRRFYVNDANNPVSEGGITNWATHYHNQTTGNLQIRVYPRPESAVTVRLYRSKHQGDMVNHGDILLVPSLPVYSLATALASRERGEVGGTPTSELFAIADAHLSDAIALDSAAYPENLIWYNDSNVSETNIRYN